MKNETKDKGKRIKDKGFGGEPQSLNPRSAQKTKRDPSLRKAFVQDDSSGARAKKQSTPLNPPAKRRETGSAAKAKRDPSLRKAFVQDDMNKRAASANDKKEVKKVPLARAAMLPAKYRTVLDTTSFSTPAKLKSAAAAVRAGRPQALMQILSEVENNLYIAGMLRTRRLAPAKLKWQVKPGIEGDAKSEEIALDCEQMLKSLNLRRAILHLQDAVFKPYACLEIEWDNTGSKVLPKLLHERMASEFTFDYEKTGEALRLVTDQAKPEGELLEDYMWMIHRSGEKGKGLAFQWLIFVNVLVNWASFTEKYGEPWRIAQYDPNLATDPQLDAIEEALANLGADAAAMFPDFVKLTLQEAQRSGSVNAFESLIALLRQDIAIGILGQVLTSAGSDDGSGSLALGQVHNEVRHDLVEFDGANLSETFSETLIRWYVWFNYGEQVAYPKFAILTDPPADVASMLLNMQAAQNMGYEITHGQMSELLDMELPKGVNADEIMQPRSSGFGMPAGPIEASARARMQGAHRRKL
jgi:phage gp29-like protein